MSTPKYPQEMRERAVRLVREIRQSEGERAGALKRVAEQLGVHYETLRLWVRQDEIDAGERGGTTTSDAERVKELEREVRELRRSNEILRSGGCRTDIAGLGRCADWLISAGDRAVRGESVSRRRGVAARA